MGVLFLEIEPQLAKTEVDLKKMSILLEKIKKKTVLVELKNDKSLHVVDFLFYDEEKFFFSLGYLGITEEKEVPLSEVEKIQYSDRITG